MRFNYNEKCAVITTYGHDRTIDKIAVSLFDSYYDGESNIENYCTTINSLKLEYNNWIFAKLVSQNTPYSLLNFIPMQFDHVIFELDDLALQKVLREIEIRDLLKAIKNTNKEIHEKIYKNMSKRAAQIFKEDMENFGHVSQKDSQQAKDNIVNIICHLEDCGEISYPQSVLTESDLDKLFTTKKDDDELESFDIENILEPGKEDENQ
jgi:flagellar motor switch protein FliG